MASEKVNPTIDTYARLTREAVKQGAEVVVWPETSCPFFLFLEWPYTSRILSLSRSVDAKLVVGSPAYENDRYFNRMWLLEKGRIGGSYDKVHLVPFGEYLPLADLLRSRFSRGLPRRWAISPLRRRPNPIGDIGVHDLLREHLPGHDPGPCHHGATCW